MAYQLWMFLHPLMLEPHVLDPSRLMDPSFQPHEDTLDPATTTRRIQRLATPVVDRFWGLVLSSLPHGKRPEGSAGLDAALAASRPPGDGEANTKETQGAGRNGHPHMQCGM